MTPGLQLDGFDLESVDDCSLPLVLRQRYRVPQAMHAGAGRLPGGWAQYMLALEPTTRRSSPMRLEYPLTATSVVRVRCDAGITLDVAADARGRSWRGSYGVGQVRIDGQGRELTISAAVRRSCGTFPPEQFTAAQAFLDEMLQGLRVPLRRGP